MLGARFLREKKAARRAARFTSGQTSTRNAMERNEDGGFIIPWIWLLMNVLAGLITLKCPLADSGYRAQATSEVHRSAVCRGTGTHALKGGRLAQSRPEWFRAMAYE
jgi:hypothetical protein